MLSSHTQILLGKSKSGENIYFPMKRVGVTLVISKPRTGKSALVKEIALRLFESGRPLLCIDSMGRSEWAAVRKMNHRAKDPKALSKLKVLKNFALPLKAFNEFDDFISLGFSPDASGFLVDWVKNKRLHSPKRMRNFLFALPATIAQLEPFNAKYAEHGLGLTSTIHYLTKNNLLTHYRRIEGWFWNGKKDKRMLLNGKILQKIWAENPWLCIQIDTISGEKYKSIGYIGNLLRSLDDNFLREMSPAIIVEEADLIAPNEKLNKQSLTSRNILRFWVNKKLRYGISIFFISQAVELLDEEIARASFDYLIGITDRKSRFFEQSKYNRLRYVGGIMRSTFTYLNVNRYAKQFLPKVTSCACWS